MSGDPFRSVVDSISELDDNQTAALALQSNHISLETSEVVSTRYAGRQRLPPGPPLGLTRNANNDLVMEHVAIVRVQPKEHIREARRLIRRSTTRGVIIGVTASAFTAAVTAILWAWIHMPRDQGEPITPPCLVSRISASAVFCRLGPQDVAVPVQQFFPDGRYRLTAIVSDQNGFSATRITDRRVFVFQTDPRLTTPSLSQQGVR